MPEDLDILAAQVMAAPKYRALDAGLVRWVVAREAAKGRSPAETVKAARAALHQAAGAYLPDRPQAQKWLDSLAAAQGDPDALRAACRAILARHVSSRERLPALDSFYATLFTGLPPAPVILDLACGLNPLAIPWMGLPPGARYLACEIDGDLAAFLRRAIPLLGVEGDAFVWNLLQGAPNRPADPPADVALLLKTIPCLEQLDSTVALRLLDLVRAPLLFVSFPVRSLGGRAKGMAQTYAARFEALAAQRPWRVARLPLAGELVYRVER